MFFNLIPLGPLDGAAVLDGVLPRSLSRIGELNRKYGMLVLMVLFFSPGLRWIMQPVYRLAGVWIGWLDRVVPV